MYKLAVFDMDGTILNTLDGLAASCNYGLEAAGFPVHDTEKYKYFVGNGALKMVERTLPESSKNEKNIQTVMRFLNEHYKETSIASTKHYGNLPEILKKLKNAGVILAVASNKPPVFSRMYADTFFGEGFFECVMGPNENIPPKPDPKMLFEVIKTCGAELWDTCYFGDSDVDILTGVNAGIATAGVTWGFRPESELINAGASCILHEYFEILDFVGAAS